MGTPLIYVTSKDTLASSKMYSEFQQQIKLAHLDIFHINICKTLTTVESLNSVGANFHAMP